MRTSPGESEGGADARSRRGSTSTYRFGAARREGHDASDFYDRFPVPEIVRDDLVNPPVVVDQVWTGDAREMDQVGQVADNSVALVVTSPPYFAGKEYEAALGEGHIPASYRAFLGMLEAVFAECVRKLEPGGRMAVNVANLGRKPYRSLSADVIDIFQRLGLLLRGEIIWVKGKASGGSCAWGSFQRPSNPVLRDLTERVIVASKGRFDRALDARRRAAAGVPSVASISADEFMDLTYDVWELAPESARRVGHPAPFPVELPRRLMELYTYEGDLVLDPFMGVGSTAVAAIRTGRHYVGFDTDPDYVARSLERIAATHQHLAVSPLASTTAKERNAPTSALAVEGATTAGGSRRNGAAESARSVTARRSPAWAADPLPTADDRRRKTTRGKGSAGPGGVDSVEVAGRSGGGEAFADVIDVGVGDGTEPDGAEGLPASVVNALGDGRKVTDVVEMLLREAGWSDVRAKAKAGPGIELAFRAVDAAGRPCYFDVVGGFSAERPGLRRMEELWKALGKASVLATAEPGSRLVLLTPDLPEPTSPGGRALEAVIGVGEGKTVLGVVRLVELDGFARLRQLAAG